MITNILQKDASFHIYQFTPFPCAIRGSHPITRIPLIKIDVEGFETQVLTGGTRMLQTIRPEAILFELNDPGTIEVRDQPVLRLLQEFNYDFFAIPRCLVRMRLQHFNPEHCQVLPAHDFLAVPRGICCERAAKLMNVRDGSKKVT